VVTYFFQNLINALQWGSFYALIALGYSMVYGVLMLFNFAHGDIFMVGAYIGFGVATGLVSLASMGALALPNWLILALTILISMFLTSFVGMIVERVGYRPLREAPRASAAITGLMIGIILETGNLAILGARRVSPSGSSRQQHSAYDFCHRFGSGSRGRDTLRGGLSCSGPLHGDYIRLEGLCGCHSGRKRLHSRGLLGRLSTRVH